MRRLAVLIAALSLFPLAVSAQGPGRGPPGPDADRAMRRGRLALTLGLAEALDLDDAQALKLRDQVQKQEPRRQAAHAQRQEAAKVLRRAADGEKVTAAEVDQAIARAFDARAQLETADRELVQAITKDLAAEKKARAALFMARFHARMGGFPGMGPPDGAGRGRGPRGAGMGRGMGPPPGAGGDDGEGGMEDVL
jgi:antitoxin (DNA-binding transcriptional repressor) of toxin-antitoxin stability system